MKDKYVLTEYALPAGLSQNLTIGLVSDIHERNMEEILALLRQGKPDLIMVAGDTFERYGTDMDAADRDARRILKEGAGTKMIRHILMRLDDLFDGISGKRTHDPENAYQFLREAGKIAPVFLSPGNHEWYWLPEDLEIMKETETRLLDNKDCEVEIKGISVRIGGLSTEADFEWLESFCGKDGYKILLCHHPEYYDPYLKDRNINLILSGHAHGGQIRIRNQGIYAPGQGLFPKYTKGIYDGKLIVTTGAANTASVPRWGNPCEVVMIQI